MSRSLLTHPDSRLRQKSQPVNVFGRELETLCHELLFLLHSKSTCVGLAAPQVGCFSRVFVVNEEFFHGKKVFINPVITDRAGKTFTDEGCLSVPNVVARVDRASAIVVEASDMYGQRFEYVAAGVPAIVLQHEIDHLDGILFIDRLSRLKRKLAFQGARV